MALALGSRIGAFEIVGHLGAGGMGEVYRARDIKLNRDVALKLLPDSFASDTERVARFTREAKTLAALNHPHIATIYGLEESNGLSALVMELVEGEDLAERIARGPIPFDEALPIANQIVDALEAAHDQGIVHRDLKPANIKLRADGAVKVLDFGLAKAGDQTGGASARLSMSPTITTPAMTELGVILGTAAYMSPEQARGRRVDKRTDVWAFGVVLFEMLSGVRPFAGEDTTEVIASVVKSPPDWSALPSGVPAPVVTLIKGCLEKDPKARIGDIAVARFLLASPDRASGTTLPAAATPRTAVVPWTIAALLGAVAIAILIAWSPWRARSSQQPAVRLDVDLGADVALPPASGGGSSVAISPDGTRIAYISGTPPTLFTRRLDQPKAVEVPGSQGASMPFFSHDNQWIGFAAGGRGNKVSVEGGAVVPLASIPARDTDWNENEKGFITRDLRQSNVSGDAGLLARPVEGGLALGEAQMLPGGKAVVFSADYPGPIDRTTIDVVSIADRRRKTIIRGGASPRYVEVNGAGYLLYVTGSALFGVPFDRNTLETRGTAVPLIDDVAHDRLVGIGQYDISRTGTLVYRRGSSSPPAMTTLEWVDGSGRRSSIPIPIKRGLIQDPAVSPDGKRIAMSIVDGPGMDVWLYDTQRGTTNRVTFGGKVYRAPRWSFDGRYLVFADVGNGIVQVRVDSGGEPQSLTRSRTYQTPTSFAPDGKHLIYTETGGGGMWLVALDERDGKLIAGTPQRLSKAGANDMAAAFSPDGRWIAFQVNQSGPSEIMVRAFPSLAGNEGTWMVSNGGGAAPHWSRTSAELLYQSGDQVQAVGYSVKGDTFIVERRRVWLDKFGAAPQVNGIPWDLAPDGKRLVVAVPIGPAQAAAADHTAVFVFNFFDELRRRVPPVH